MRKYSTGYIIINVISFIGFLTVVVSLFGGIIFVANAPNGMSYLGWLFTIGGSIQGMMLIGMGSIGLAILDGSIAQQHSLNKLDALVAYIRSFDGSQGQTSNTSIEPTNIDYSKIKPMTPL